MLEYQKSFSPPQPLPSLIDKINVDLTPIIHLPLSSRYDLFKTYYSSTYRKERSGLLVRVLHKRTKPTQTWTLRSWAPKADFKISFAPIMWWRNK